MTKSFKLETLLILTISFTIPLDMILFYFLFNSQRVLGITKGMEDLGGMQWELFGTLVLGWIIVYLIIWKGLHSSGKVI